MPMKPRKLLSLLFLTFLIFSLQSCQKKSDVINENISDKAVAELRHTLRTQEGWVKVHAAEYLVALSYPAGVHEIFMEELKEHATTPQYRIGIWRTLARASFNPQERQEWIDKIWNVYLDENSSDRLHAIETLAKLNENLLSREPQIARRLLAGSDTRLAAFVRWGMAVNTDNQQHVNALVAALNSDDLYTRQIAAYGIRLKVNITPEQWQTLYRAASNEPDSSSAAVYLVGAAYAKMPGNTQSTKIEQQLHQRLRSFLFSDTKGNRYNACDALADRGTEKDLPALYNILNGELQLKNATLPTETLATQNTDVRSAAANAILRIYRRIPAKMSSIDWLVIAIYGIGMLAIGWYYAGKTKNSEDYNLGGRRMNPMLVGLSLFASLLSTLSYLAYPGEMIKNGPMYFTNLLVFPLVYLIVGYWFIPSIMRLKVTSANEILELKLGKNIRLLGTFFFLSLRLLWMATIIYATVDNVLLPIFGIDASYLPLVCAIMGVVTLIYTSMGGLRAVVLTDVIQTIILIGGIVLTIALVSFHFGSLTSWLPHKWAAHWSDIKIGFDPKIRVTMFNAMLMVFGWYICTAGSDQMAIQRYLATRDAKSARRSFGISILTNLVVQVLLAIVGLALLAYFTNIPHLLPDSNTILSVADRLFSQYILMGLPVGLTGLLTAGLMAAAMSSLSSGVNSSATVISEDILNRFLKKKSRTEADLMRRVKLVAVGIGSVVVLISMFLGNVQGNLLDMLIKVVNLFVAPLFLLFFMAMYIPWATSFGTFIAGISCVAIGVGIAFYNIFGIGIFFALPLSFVGGAVIGMIVSLLPTAKPQQIAN